MSHRQGPFGWIASQPNFSGGGPPQYPVTASRSTQISYSYAPSYVQMPRTSSWPNAGAYTEQRTPPLLKDKPVYKGDNLIDLDSGTPDSEPNRKRDFIIPSSKPSKGSTEGSRPHSKFAVLLLGGTGVGKSSFIAKLTGAPVKVGKTLQSCTVEPEGWDYMYNRDVTLTLIDTPGFDDMQRPDMEVLEAIVRYIQGEQSPRIIGIIYMYKIIEKRIIGAAARNLRMLQALCGEHFYQNVILTTTMWGTVPAAVFPELETREAQLNGGSAFWADMIEKGSEYARYDDTIASGRAILETCLSKRNPPQLNIVLELKRHKMSLEDTSAGRIITAELRKREEKKRQELLEEEREEALLLQANKEKEAQLRAAEEQVSQARTRSAVVPRRQVQSQVYTGVDELVRQQGEGQWGSTSSQGGQVGASSQGRGKYMRQARMLHRGKKRPGGGLGWFSLR